MITINLLSFQEKKDITSEKTKFSIIGSFIVLFFVLFALSFFLFTINDLQKQQLNSLTQNSKNQEKFLNQENNKLIENKIKDINYYLSSIKTIETERTNFAKVLLKIAELTPDGIRIYDINLDKTEKSFEINGNANSRDNLIKFNESLEKAQLFTEIKSPLSNLISPTDINFSLTGNLTDQALKP